VTRAPVEEIGWRAVRRTSAGAAGHLFAGLESELTIILRRHGYNFAIPESGRLLATGEEVTPQTVSPGARPTDCRSTWRAPWKSCAPVSPPRGSRYPCWSPLLSMAASSPLKRTHIRHFRRPGRRRRPLRRVPGPRIERERRA
jgi:hypothetical protein